MDFTQPPDQDALTLTHAIALQESSTDGTTPNYTASGDNGTSAGAYQWSNGTSSPALTQGQIPKNFQDDATAAGLDPNDFSAENQDKVAYYKVKTYKDQGYSAAQIASLWNSGSPDNWQNHSGTTTINGKQVAYDTPAYVNSVKNYYQKLSGTPPPPSTGETTPNAPLPNPSLTGINNENMNISGGTSAISTTPGTLETLGNVGKGLISGTIASGEDIAAAIGGNTMMAKFNALSQADSQYLTTILQLRNKAAQAGNKDEVAHFQNLIKNYKTTDGDSITDVFPALNKSTEQVIGDFASMALETIGTAEGAQGIAEMTRAAAPAIAETVAKPFINRLGSAALTGGTYGAGFGAAGAMQNNDTGTGIAKSAAVGGTIGAITGAGIETGLSGINTLAGSNKTLDQVLATSEEDVKTKLTPREQKAWYQNQATESIAKATAAGQESMQEVQSSIDDLKQKIGQSSRDEAINLKQPAQKVMRDASAEYVALTGEAADGSPALQKTMLSTDLSTKIDSKFEYNPEIAASLKETLGITEPAEGEKPQEISNQDILNQARSLMQDVSKSARTGNSVYSAAEYQAMQKYSFLMQTLGDNGVDMTEANKFWKEYAPFRDRMVREIKPFDETNVGKMPITTTLQNAASTGGTAKQAVSRLDAQNFIDELETRMNVPKGTIGSDTRDLISQLDSANLNKDNIAEITKETKAQIAADKKSNLYNAETRAQRSARINKIIGKIIKGLVGVGVGYLTDKFTGAGVGALAAEVLVK